MLKTKTIEKEGYTENQEESVTIVDAVDNESNQVNPIAEALKGKGDALELLVKACHCKLNKKHRYITDVAGRVIKISQLFEYFGIITTGDTRCPKCFEPVSYDLLFYHFDDHKFTLEKIRDLFRRNFNQWSYTNGKFTYMGEDIEI